MRLFLAAIWARRCTSVEEPRLHVGDGVDGAGLVVDKRQHTQQVQLTHEVTALASVLPRDCGVTAPGLILALDDTVQVDDEEHEDEDGHREQQEDRHLSGMSGRYRQSGSVSAAHQFMSSM